MFEYISHRRAGPGGNVPYMTRNPLIRLGRRGGLSKYHIGDPAQVPGPGAWAPGFVPRAVAWVFGFFQAWFFGFFFALSAGFFWREARKKIKSPSELGIPAKHHKQLVDFCDGTQLAFFAQSLFGLVHVWNALPERVVQKCFVKTSQRQLPSFAQNF